MKQYIMHVLGSVSQELYFPDAHLTDIIEILILTYLIYHIAMWLINTKAWMLMRGIVVLGIFVLLAAVFKMHTILFLARNSVTVLATAAVVVFQPELRRALEKLGEKQFLSSIVPFETNKESSRFSEDTMDSIIDAAYNMGRVKTGALIECAMMIGAILGGAEEEDVRKVEKIAHYVGIAFQIQDDILDVTSTEEVLGKPIHSDEKNQKTTYVTLLGIEQAQKRVEELSNQAIDLLHQLSGENEYLEQLLIQLIHRDR